MNAMHRWYRATGADPPFGDPLPAHGVAMEGYFWRFTRPDTGDVVIALCGVNGSGRAGDKWATVGSAGHPCGFLRAVAHAEAPADRQRLGARAGTVFEADEQRVRVAFAGGEVSAGPLHTEMTALVVGMPDGTTLRLGNPVVSPVRAEVARRGHGGDATGAVPVA